MIAARDITFSLIDPDQRLRLIIRACIIRFFSGYRYRDISWDYDTHAVIADAVKTAHPQREGVDVCHNEPFPGINLSGNHSGLNR